LCNDEKLTVTMAVDLKKWGIRIHKTAFRMMGEPKLVQLLVNPDNLEVAVRAVDVEIPGDSVHRIRKARMDSDSSYEIYSRSFVRELSAIAGNLDKGFTYRLTGSFVPSERMLVFSLKTLQKFDKQRDTSNG